MYATGSRALLVLLIASSCSAADAPAILQSTPNFSNAIAGPGFDVTWTAIPSELSIDGSIELTIRFVGVTNPDRVRRPDLAARPRFKSNFREILKGPDVPPEATSIAFTYRLRPRDESVRAIPELEVAYFKPGTGRGTLYLDEITLTIKHSASVTATVRPLDAPERFFALPDSASMRPPSWLAWTGLIAVLFFSPLAWIALWRFRNPDGVRLAKLRRNRAVRTALDGLDRAGHSPEPVVATVKVFHDYLASRYGAAAPSPTPGDIGRAMAEVQLLAEQIAEAVQLVRDCDASRFAGESDRETFPIRRVRQLILAWEERP